MFGLVQQMGARHRLLVANHVVGERSREKGLTEGCDRGANAR